MEKKPQERYFFALWPDPMLAKKLSTSAKVALPNDQHLVDLKKLHLTLAYLGVIKEEQVRQAIRIASAVKQPAFELCIHQIKQWRGNKLLYYALDKTPEGLKNLHHDLQVGLEGAGFISDKRPFIPHITLARHSPEPLKPVDLQPLVWKVRRFYLVKSRQSSYEVVQAWDLLKV